MIKPEFQASFAKFIQTGEGDEAFLAYLDRDAECQRAVEEALEVEAAGFRGFAKGLRSEWERQAAALPELQGHHELQARLVEALKGFLEAEPNTRKGILEGADTQLQTVPSAGSKAMALHELSEEIERVARSDKLASAQAALRRNLGAT